MKKTKIIIPAMGMLLLGTAASVTGTVAWFSSNNKVNIDGMKVHTSVKGNLMIANINTNNANDGVYSTSNLTQASSSLLEPVSTADGNSFFYTTEGVLGSGQTTATSLSAYSTEAAGLTAFNTAYGTTGAVGYVDYSFYLKATSDSDLQKVSISKVNLLYNGTSLGTDDKSWRVAIFAEPVAINTASGEGLVLKSILGPSSAAYFENKAAVAATGENIFGAISNFGSNAVLGTISNKGQTQRYKVVVRLYLEGNDTKCNNSTYALLTEDYALYLQCQLGDAGAQQISSLIAAQVTNTNLVASVAAQNDEEIVSRQWQLYSDSAWGDISEQTAASYTGTAGQIVRCQVVTKTGTYVTNSVTLTAGA